MITPIGNTPSLPPSSNGDQDPRTRAYQLLTDIQQAILGQGPYSPPLSNLITEQIELQNEAGPGLPPDIDPVWGSITSRLKQISSDMKQLDNLTPGLSKAAQDFVKQFKNSLTQILPSSMYTDGTLSIHDGGDVGIIDNAPSTDAITNIGLDASNTATELSNL